ncbi:BCCT family transporter [Kocuria rhizophila]|nr:BCCT family transporter [Kocuria rhizophila]
MDLFAIVGSSRHLRLPGAGHAPDRKGLQIVTGIGEVGDGAGPGSSRCSRACSWSPPSSGVAKGIRRLSNINMMLAAALAFFLFVAGPTVFLLDSSPPWWARTSGRCSRCSPLSASWGPEAEGSSCAPGPCSLGVVGVLGPFRWGCSSPGLSRSHALAST